MVVAYCSADPPHSWALRCGIALPPSLLSVSLWSSPCPPHDRRYNRAWGSLLQSARGPSAFTSPMPSGLRHLDQDDVQRLEMALQTKSARGHYRREMALVCNAGPPTAVSDVGVSRSSLDRVS